MVISGVSVPSVFWSLVRLNSRVLIRSCSRSVACAFLALEESTQRFQTFNKITIRIKQRSHKKRIKFLKSMYTANWSNGETRKKRKSEYISSSLFWTGVPVTTQRRNARSRQTDWDTPDFGLRMTWASSKMIRLKAICKRIDWFISFACVSTSKSPIGCESACLLSTDTLAISRETI